MSPALKTQIRVRSYELDSFGHVNNAVFLNYLEYGRGEFMSQRGLSFNDFQRWKAFPYVIKVMIEYKAPAFYNDLLEISGEIIRWSRTSFTLAKKIFNQTTNKLAATAEVTLVFVNEKQRPTAIPQEFRDKFGLTEPEKK